MEFMDEFKDLCERLRGKLSKDELGLPVCYLEDEAVLIGYPDFNAISLEKKGETVLDIAGFDRTVLTSKYIPAQRFREKGLGRYFACFKTKVAGICINERGDIVKVLIPEKPEYL